MGYISPEIPTATLLLSCFKQTFPCQVAKYPEAFGGRLVPSILAGQPPSILGQPPQFQQVSPLNFGLAPSILVGQPPQFWQVSLLNFGRLARSILVGQPPQFWYTVCSSGHLSLLPLLLVSLPEPTQLPVTCMQCRNTTKHLPFGSEI